MSRRDLLPLRMALAFAAPTVLLLAACSSGGAPAAKDTVPPPTATAFVAKVGNAAGNRAPDFTVTGINGQTVSLSGLLEEGKPFVLYFFATW